MPSRLLLQSCSWCRRNSRCYNHAFHTHAYGSTSTCGHVPFSLFTRVFDLSRLACSLSHASANDEPTMVSGMARKKIPQNCVVTTTDQHAARRTRLLVDTALCVVRDAADHRHGANHPPCCSPWVAVTYRPERCQFNHIAFYGVHYQVQGVERR